METNPHISLQSVSKNHVQIWNAKYDELFFHYNIVCMNFMNYHLDESILKRNLSLY